eukprot:SAG31_NODE_2515_length_5581_cov_2.798978_2_plen_121_part_01
MVCAARVRVRACSFIGSCLKEVHTALQNRVRIIPIRLELDLPGEAEQWPQLQAASTNIADIMMRTEVLEGLNKLNSIPARGTLPEQRAAELPKLLDQVRALHGRGAVSAAPAALAAAELAA